MTKYIGNFSEQLKIKNLLATVKETTGDRRTFEGTYFDLSKPGFTEIMDNWSKAEYNLSSIEWFNYYSGIQFSKSYASEFGNLVNAEPVKVWISEIKSGKCFPYHWDVDTDTSMYVEEKMVRYQMMLEDYVLGHFFVLDDITLTGYKMGDVYQWDNYKDWHGGGNISFTNKYTFNFLGKHND